SAAKSMKMVLYQKVTTFKKTEVLSNWSGTGEGIELVFPMMFAAQDMIVVNFDPLGLGENAEPFTYIHSEIEANQSIDVVRAAREFCDQKSVDYQKELYLYGFSAGAHACMAMAKRVANDENLKKHFPIAQMVLGAGPYDLSGEMVSRVFAYPHANYWGCGNNILLLIAAAQHSGYKMYDKPSDIFRSSYDSLYTHYVENLNGEMKEHLPTRWQTIFRPEVVADFQKNQNHPLRKFLKENDLYDWYNPFPTIFYYGEYDEEVPYQCSLKAHAAQRKHLLFHGKDLGQLKIQRISKEGWVWLPFHQNHRALAISCAKKAIKVFEKS
ncbi:MAG: alpha/beta hydrolase family protein, partial [Bacteroidia bacterium]